MTALSQFERLEAMARWHDATHPAGREVVLSLGDATLTLRDPGNETALDHWSLPALQRLNPGQYPARFALQQDALHNQRDKLSDWLETDDPLMISAIEKLQSAVERHHRGHVSNHHRRGYVIGILVALLGFAALWRALPDYVSWIAPPAQYDQMDVSMISALEAHDLWVCSEPRGRTILNDIASELSIAPSKLIVMEGPALPARVVSLPGGTKIIAASWLKAMDGPDELRKQLLDGMSDVQGTQDFAQALRSTGPKTVIRTLLGYPITAREMARTSENWLKQMAITPPSEPDLQTRNRAEITQNEFPESFQGLDDQSWLLLQQICPARGGKT